MAIPALNMLYFVSPKNEEKEILWAQKYLTIYSMHKVFQKILNLTAIHDIFIVVTKNKCKLTILKWAIDERKAKDFLSVNIFSQVCIH